MRRVSMLPSLLTLGNFVSGFISIIFCAQSIYKHSLAQKAAEADVAGLLAQSDGLFRYACLAIFFGMMFDVLDGRVARMTGSASRFGGELDSLADCCSFGIAPAMLAATLWIRVQPDTAQWWSYVMVCGIVYAACAVIRLARYNVEMETTKKNYFAGLPSPGAAGAVASLILLCQQPYMADIFTTLYNPVIARLPVEPRPAQHSLYILSTYMLLVGLLMVSRYRFMHVANKMLSGRKKVTWLVAAVFLIALLYQHPEEVLFVAFNAYVLVSLIANFRRPEPEAVGHGEADDEADRDV